jgi:hypothetical protein
VFEPGASGFRSAARVSVNQNTRLKKQWGIFHREDGPVLRSRRGTLPFAIDNLAESKLEGILARHLVPSSNNTLARSYSLLSGMVILKMAISRLGIIQ